jgi:son of sevenless-like protein
LNILASELKATQALIDEMEDEEKAFAKQQMIADDYDLIFEQAPERADICDYPADKVAISLTARDYRLFANVGPREFCDKGWTRKETAEKNSPNILRMVDEFNKRSFWVATEIVNREDFGERARCVKHFIDVAQQCKDLHNFHSVFSIVSGLSMAPIWRLKQLWAKVGKAHVDKFEALKKSVTDNSFNARAPRKIFKAGLGRAQIPHMAIVLKDCFQLEEISTMDKATGNINFGKFMKQYRELADVFQSQSIPYQLTPDKMVNAVVAACNKTLLKEDKLWSRSYRYEPKEKDGDKKQ